MRLLILAYDFPPNGSIGGQRPYGWLKYLKEFGIHPVVVTRHWGTVVTPDDTIRPCGTEVTVTESDEGTLIRVPYRPNLRDRMLLRFGNRFEVFRKMLSLWFMLAQYHIAWADNRRNMLDAARECLQKSPCDAIIATGEPFILFRYAQLLSKEFGIPWIADYRDGWSTNYNTLASTSGADHFVNALFTRPLERTTLKSSLLITTTAPALRDELMRLHPEKTCEVVYNGYFPEPFLTRVRTDRNEHRPFTVVYSGTMYPYQQLEVFLNGLSNLIHQRRLTPEHIRVEFLGLDYQPDQMHRLMSFDTQLSPFLRPTARMPHSEAITELGKGDLLLLLANRKFGQIYAKVFDYMALEIPVLLCENDHGPLESILNEVGTGLVADTPEEVSEILASMMDGRLKVSPDRKAVKRYSRKEQTGRLAYLLKETVRK